MTPLTDIQLALLSAAFRHASDASGLLPSSPDQTFHLSGLALECIQKATLSDPTLNKAIGHIGDEAGSLAWIYALVIDATASRYVRKPKQIVDWHVECRYERTGTRSSVNAKKALTSAWDAFDSIAVALFADGRIEGDFS